MNRIRSDRRIELKKRWIAEGRNRCTYCKVRLDVLTMTVDHYVPLSEGGTNKQENLCPACDICNGLKGNELAEDFMRRMGLVEKAIEERAG